MEAYSFNAMFLKLSYQRVIIWAVSFLALLAIVLISLPIGIQLGIERGLSSLGAEQATVKDVDFNPFVGCLIVKELQVNSGKTPPLLLKEARLQVSWWSLWSRRIVLEKFVIQGLKAEVAQTSDGKVQIAGIVLPPSEQGADPAGGDNASDEQPWGFGVTQFQFDASDISYRSDALNMLMRIDSLRLSNLLSYAEAIPAIATFHGAINGAPLNISLHATPFSLPRNAKGNIQLQALQLADFNQSLPPTIKELKGKLSVNINLDAQQNDNDNFKLGIHGDTNLADFGLQMPEQNLSVHHESLGWQGAINLAQQAQQLSWVVEGDIKSTNSAVLQKINGEQVPLLAIGAAEITGLSVSQVPNLAIDDIQLTSVKVQLSKTKDGVLLLPGGGATQPQERADDVTVTAAEKTMPTPAPTISLRRLKISGDSAVLFNDDSVTPPFKLNLQLSEMLLEGMDNTRADQPTAFSMTGKFDKFSDIVLTGKLYPFSEKLTLDVTGNIKSFELPTLSSYTAPALGHNLASGQLAAKINIKVDQGVINSENKLNIKQLVLKPGDPEKMEKFNKGLSMPLDSALSLLRDKNDNIQLKLPITGNLENPNFDIADAINQSLSTAMKFAAMSYIKLALQPFGTMVSVFQMATSAGKMASAVRLDPVKFTVGSSQLDDVVKDYLDNTIKLLTTRPNLNLKVCGKATVPDLTPILKKQGKETTLKKQQTGNGKEGSVVLSAEHEQLLMALAQARSVSVKNYLVTNGGVDAGRLFICHPEIDRDQAATSRTELTI